jgi:putative ABC transport system permease protein
MIKRYFRTFRKNSGQSGISFINVVGLSLGLMSVLLIFLYINYEKSFDRFFQDNERIYRLVFYRHYKTGLDVSIGNNYYIGQLASEKIPGIDKFCRVKKEAVFINRGEQLFKEENTLFADSTFFDIFSHQVISGDKKTFLRMPDEAVITESLSKRYFGGTNPIGEILQVGKKSLIVRGVVKDVPRNSHLKFDIVISLSTITDAGYCYSCNNTATYFLIGKSKDPTVLENEITMLGKREFISRGVNIDFPVEFKLQKLTDIHLHSNYRFEFQPNGNDKTLSVLLLIALLILVSAGLNYLNLYSSIIRKRTTQIGIKRANGASGKDIVLELIYESELTGVLSLIISYILLFFLFPLFRDFLNLDLDLRTSLSYKIWSIPLLIITFFSILTGFSLGIKVYDRIPASFIRQDNVLRNKRLSGRLFLTLQLVIALSLICITIIAMKQIDYMKNDALTMDMENILVIKRPTSSAFNTAQNSFQESILRIPGVTGYTFSTISPGEKNSWVKGGISLKGEEKLDYQFFQMDVSPDFFDFFKVKLLEGRQFYKDENNWTGSARHLILNKEAARAFGKTDLKELIGKTMFDADSKENIGEIVGIIDGYFQNSLDQEVKPMIFNCDQIGYYIYIKLKEKDKQAILDNVITQFHTHFKNQYLEYYFLDDYFNSQYNSHILLFRSILLFCVMAVIITSLSLFGLALTEIIKRTKEIGIHKINGASVAKVLYILNKEYIILVLAASVVSLPASYIIGKKWIENFAYCTTLDWWIFLAACLSTILIALTTLSWQSWKAATKNPVDSLRYE